MLFWSDSRNHKYGFQSPFALLSLTYQKTCGPFCKRSADIYTCNENSVHELILAHPKCCQKCSYSEASWEKSNSSSTLNIPGLFRRYWQKRKFISNAIYCYANSLSDLLLQNCSNLIFASRSLYISESREIYQATNSSKWHFVVLLA